MKEKIMKNIINLAKETSKNGIGGPFGAAIVKDDKMIAYAVNTVLNDNDPTAHAEVNAIRKACKFLGTHDLTGYTLYCTGYPCPMCLSAIIWANIKDIYYCNEVSEAEEIGFRDSHIYNALENSDNLLNILNIKKLHIENTLYKDYETNELKMY